MSISEIIKICYFLGKRFSEMKKDDQDAIESIAKEVQSELNKKDGFDIDVSYKEKVWREFYQRGVIRNTISIIIYIMLFLFILSIGVVYLPVAIAKRYLIHIFKYSKSTKENVQENLQEAPQERHLEPLQETDEETHRDKTE